MVRPLVENKTIVDPDWLAGFTSGEGCYLIFIQANVAHTLGCQVLIEFQLTQHVRDEQLMNSLIKFFDCGKIDKAKISQKPPPHRGGGFCQILTKIFFFIKKNNFC